MSQILSVYIPIDLPVFPNVYTRMWI